MAPIATAQADQIQALKHFHGYPLDFFLSCGYLLDFFSQRLNGCRSFSWALLSRITKPLDRSGNALEL